MTTSRPFAPTSRRLAALAAVATLGLAGCSGGTTVDAQTNHQYQAGVGANVRTGNIQLFNALAVDNGDGTATFSAAILNTDPTSAKLQGATAKLVPLAGAKAAPVTVTTAPAIIAGGQMFNTGKAGTILLTDKDVVAGEYVRITLKFSGGRRVSVEAPVVARSAMYDGVATGPGGEASGNTAPKVVNPATPGPTAAAPAAR